MNVRKTSEFETWFRGLRDAKVRMQINARLLRLVGGNPGDVAPVGGGVSELRIHLGPGYRVYCTRRTDGWIILCGGDKSTQDRDIKQALAFAARL